MSTIKFGKLFHTQPAKGHAEKKIIWCAQDKKIFSICPFAGSVIPHAHYASRKKNNIFLYHNEKYSLIIYIILFPLLLDVKL